MRSLHLQSTTAEFFALCTRLKFGVVSHQINVDAFYPVELLDDPSIPNNYIQMTKGFYGLLEEVWCEEQNTYVRGFYAHGVTKPTDNAN